MRCLFIAILLAVAGCSSSAPPLSKPGKDALLWDLNQGRWPGTNVLITEPKTPGVN